MFALTLAKNDIAANINKPSKEKRMKIKCDVCDKSEASVFCSADEAALCDACDRHVHHANKLASKHHRFYLLQLSSKQSPLCDICQERRAFLFCQEDRAILCRECDIPIHKANEHTKKHNRFLLTGVKLSTCSSLYPTTTSSSNSCTDSKKNNKNQPYLHNINTPTFSNEMLSSSSVERASSPSPSPSPSSNNNNNNNNNFDDNVTSISTSSISEYLSTLPGWRVDDFLDPSIADDGLIRKSIDNFLPLVVDHQDLENPIGSFSPEDDLNFWVPLIAPYDQSDVYNLLLDGSEANNGKGLNRKWSDDDNAFTVPEMMIHRPVKKSRHNFL